MVRPEMVAQFAESHDANTWGCLARLIGAEPSAHSQVTASGIFKDVRFYSTRNFGQFWADPHFQEAQNLEFLPHLKF